MIEYKITIFNNYKCESTMTLTFCDGEGTFTWSATKEKILISLN
jgi:hypothetical protein